MDRGVLAAIRLLPRHKLAIQELVLGDEDFRALCADLADAQEALRRWQSSVTVESAERCVEYRHLVAALEAELRLALRSK